MGWFCSECNCHNFILNKRCVYCYLFLSKTSLPCFVLFEFFNGDGDGLILWREEKPVGVLRSYR